MYDFGDVDCNEIVNIKAIPMRCICVIVDYNLIKIAIVQKVNKITYYNHLAFSDLFVIYDRHFSCHAI